MSMMRLQGPGDLGHGEEDLGRFTNESARMKSERQDWATGRERFQAGELDEYVFQQRMEKMMKSDEVLDEGSKGQAAPEPNRDDS